MLQTVIPDNFTGGRKNETEDRNGLKYGIIMYAGIFFRKLD